MIVYWSGSGTTKRIAEAYGGVPLDHYVPGQPFTLIVPTYGSPRTGGYIPDPILDFLAFHGHFMEAVVGVGNTVFGEDFCRGAKDISTVFSVPLAMRIDLVPTKEQDYALNKIKVNYEEIPRPKRSA